MIFMQLTCVETASVINGVSDDLNRLFDHVMSGAPQDIIEVAEAALLESEDHVTRSGSSTVDGNYYSFYATKTEQV